MREYFNRYCNAWLTHKPGKLFSPEKIVLFILRYMKQDGRLETFFVSHEDVETNDDFYACTEVLEERPTERLFTITFTNNKDEVRVFKVDTRDYIEVSI